MEYLREMSELPRFAAAAHRPARRRLWESEKSSPIVRLLVGSAVGDAFAFGVSLQDAHWLRRAVKRFGEWPHNPVMREALRQNNVRGFYSDHTEQLLGTVKGLSRHGVAVEAVAMLSAWRDEWELSQRRPPPAVRGVPRQGEGALGRMFRGEVSLEQTHAEQAARGDPGSDPLAAAPPLGWIGLSAERARLAAECSDATHPHPKARAACLLIAFCSRHLAVLHRPPADLIRAAAAHLEASPLAEPETLAHLRALERLPDFHEFGARFCAMPREVHAQLCGPQPCPQAAHVPAGADGRQPMEGLHSDAMRTAGVVLYLCKFQRGPIDVLTAAIDMGGDIDAVAMLCLGIVAAADDLHFGKSNGLSWRLLEELEGLEYLIVQAKAFEAWLENLRLGDDDSSPFAATSQPSNDEPSSVTMADASVGCTWVLGVATIAVVMAAVLAAKPIAYRLLIRRD
ncbi:hypothetical protein AB1Y20_021359 [Prymnesium parvum]|uniref:Uncharacterized protein n=1 Tax=Prymnesium parvum TaxID=97485 RepID=A0AB34JJH9_PRYPA